MMFLRINYLLPKSRANGPGSRFTIWVQGCSIHCPGCSNTDTWDPLKGYSISVNELVDIIKAESTMDGITITGGEPLDQFDAIYNLCFKIFGTYSIFLTTGYTLKQIHQKKQTKIMNVLDIACLGPFEKDKVCKNKWKGSENQEIVYLTDLGVTQSLLPVVSKEIRISKMGEAFVTGFTR